ncbi:MAG: DUF1127 domain-containing protein [Chromatiaceae bacterium]|nr:DUF1127 domain-containing protein [Chromatiaceae bacterium]
MRPPAAATRARPSRARSHSGCLWLQRARQRRQLSQLADWQLDDIGISRNAAQTEAAKTFWRE